MNKSALRHSLDPSKERSSRTKSKSYSENIREGHDWKKRSGLYRNHIIPIHGNSRKEKTGGFNSDGVYLQSQHRKSSNLVHVGVRNSQKSMNSNNAAVRSYDLKGNTLKESSLFSSTNFTRKRNTKLLHRHSQSNMKMEDLRSNHHFLSGKRDLKNILSSSKQNGSVAIKTNSDFFLPFYAKERNSNSLMMKESMKKTLSRKPSKRSSGSQPNIRKTTSRSGSRKSPIAYNLVKDISGANLKRQRKSMNEGGVNISSKLLKSSKRHKMKHSSSVGVLSKPSSSTTRKLKFSFTKRTRKGYNPNIPNKPNQDSMIVKSCFMGDPEFHVFGVFDGHGVQGEKVSKFCSDNFANHLLKEVMRNNEKEKKSPFEELIFFTFDKLVKSLLKTTIECVLSGCTANICIIKGQSLYVTNIGDSRSIIGFIDDDDNLRTKPLSFDHKPEVDSEKNRIIRGGGRVARARDQYGRTGGPLRVWLAHEQVPGLAMTRSIGDLIAASVGVTWKPEIAIYRLYDQDKMIVVASDGVWDVFENDRVIQFLYPFYEEQNIEEGADQLLAECVNRWKPDGMVDDITFVILSVK